MRSLMVGTQNLYIEGWVDLDPRCTVYWNRELPGFSPRTLPASGTWPQLVWRHRQRQQVLVLLSGSGLGHPSIRCGCKSCVWCPSWCICKAEMKQNKVGIWMVNIWIAKTAELQTFTCSVFRWFTIQMPCTIVTGHLNSGPVFKWGSECNGITDRTGPLACLSLSSCFWVQYSMLLQYEIVKKLVAWILVS